MDKYEYRIKAEQIEKLIGKKDFKTAMKIADTIDWRRIKNISMLFKVSDIYEKNEKYGESKDILLLAYERSPLGRMIVYKLVELSLKLNEYGEAIEFYREFLQLAPHDPSRYILKYKIQKEMKVSPKELVEVLKEFKEKEYHEEWAYELASLYHQAGMADKCVEECDELILWFDKGNYVEKAMELKMLYQPLTPAQQEKYDHRNDVIENTKAIGEVDTPPEEKENAEEVFDPKPEIRADNIDYKQDKDNKDSGSFKLRKIFLNKKMISVKRNEKTSVKEEPIQVKPLSVGKFDTINLQAELAKSVESILESTNDKYQIQAMLSEDYNGQISLNIEEENKTDPQITGQMNIEEILAELEKSKEVKGQKEEEREEGHIEKEKAFYETGDIMDLLSDVVPQLDNSDESSEIFETEITKEVDKEEAEVEETVGEETEEKAIIKETDKEEAEEKEVVEEDKKFNTDFEETGKDIDEKLFEEFKYSPFTVNQLQNVIQHLDSIDVAANERNIRNIIVTGEPGTGKTTLAIELLRVIHKNRNQKLGKLAKIKGQALNSKEVSKVAEKIEGGVLIIEEAGNLSEKTIKDLNQIISTSDNNIAVVLEDEKKSLELLFCKYDYFAERFITKINLPDYSNEELVNFGKQYANTKGYEVDEMGVLALYTRVGEIQDDDRTIKLDEIKEILDEAIEYSNKKKIRKLVNKIIGKRYSDSDLVLLHEQDFQI